MKTLNKEQFKTLTLIEQVQHTLDFGEEILERIYIYYAIKLYAVNDFFVELWYHQTGNHIGKVKLIDEEHVLHYYGDKIDISDALK